MKNKPAARSQILAVLGAMLSAMLLAACVTKPPQREHGSMAAALRYHQSLARMSPPELARERATLGASPMTPQARLRLAMLYASPRHEPDYERALNLLEAVLRSADPAATALHPLARLLAEQYTERQRLDARLDRQARQLQETQRTATELQDKLDSLADIERKLNSRPAAGPRRRGDGR